MRERKVSFRAAMLLLGLVLSMTLSSCAQLSEDLKDFNPIPTLESMLQQPTEGATRRAPLPTQPAGDQGGSPNGSSGGSNGSFVAAPTLPAVNGSLPVTGNAAGGPSADLVALYQQANPGVVNIGVLTQQGGGTGSGFVIDDQGHIVTNNHVVGGADSVTVTFYNGIERHAEVVGTDPDSDLAVIRVQNVPAGVHSLPLADSDQVKVGEWVIAIGSPFGLGASMSTGIVSATGRTIPAGATPFSIPHAIQTDAAINPGNSGGPLINMAGAVIGINAQIATGGTEQSSGVGFAIPSNIARRVVPSLIQSGEYRWPWLGVTGSPLTLEIAEANDLTIEQGAYIHEVVPGGPADQAGLRGSSSPNQPVGGDVIVAVDGNPIASFDDVLAYIGSRSPGDQVTLTIVRGGQQQDVVVTLQERQRQTQQDRSPLFP